ncbi:hypothetical protein BZA77DRAFT_364513 [Pyronema omphalodes]|nr:hypothetical protein BZA77DRAFT_364513 [Pyronema omphalodes]
MALLGGPTGHFGIISVYHLLVLSLILPSINGSPVSIANSLQASNTEPKTKQNQTSPPWDTRDKDTQSSDDDDDSYLIFDDMAEYWNFYPYTTAIRTDLSEDEHSFFGGLGARTRDAEQREIDQTYLWFLPAKTITSVETLYGQTTTETDYFTVTTTATVISRQTVTVRATAAPNKDLPPLEKARPTEPYPLHSGSQSTSGSKGNKESSHNSLDVPVTTGLLFAEDTGGWLDPDSSNSIDPPILTLPGSIWPIPTGSVSETRDPNTDIQAFAWPTNSKKTETATLPHVLVTPPERPDTTAKVTKGPESRNQSEDWPRRPIPMALLPKHNQSHNTHTKDLNRRTASPNPRRLRQFHTFRPRPLRQGSSIASGQSSSHKNSFEHPKTQIIAEVNLLVPSANPLKLVQNAEPPRQPTMHRQPDCENKIRPLISRSSPTLNQLESSMLTKRSAELTVPGRSNVIFHGLQKQESEPGIPRESKPPMENQAPENKSEEISAVKANPEKVIPEDNKVTDSKSGKTTPEKGEDSPKDSKPVDNKVTDSKLDGVAPEKGGDKKYEDQPIENPVAVETAAADTTVEMGDQNIAVAPEPTTSNPNNSDSSVVITVLRVAQIVGFIVVGIVLATLVVLMFIWCSQPLWWPCCLKRKNKKQEMKQSQNTEHDQANDREALPTTPAPPAPPQQSPPQQAPPQQAPPQQSPPQQAPPSTTHQTNSAPPQQIPPSTSQHNSIAPKPPKVTPITNLVASATPGNAQSTLAPSVHQASASSGGSSKTNGATSSTNKSSHSTKVSSQNNNTAAASALKPSPSPSKPPPPPPPQVSSNTPTPNPPPAPVPEPSKPQPLVPNNTPIKVPIPSKPAPPAPPIPAPSPSRVPSATPNTTIAPLQIPQDIPATDGATDIWPSSEENYGNTGRDSSSVDNPTGRMSSYRYLSHSRGQSVPGTFPDSR